MNNLIEMNPFAATILSIIEIQPKDFCRFRDAFLKDDPLRFCVITRCGGNNREVFPELYQTVKQHLGYIRDYDDPFDSTYSYIEFEIPEDHKEVFEEWFEKKPTLKKLFIDERTMEGRVQNLLSRMRGVAM